MKIKSIIAVVFVLTIVSCKKDRTCECTYTTSTGGSSTQTITYKKISKGEANNICQKTNVSQTGYSTVDDCKLK